MGQRIYLDHAATTPLLPEARDAMAAALGAWANPSSPHREGRAARAALEEARRRIAGALGWTGDLIVTGGATESARIALTRTIAPRPAILSAVEHQAVFRQRPDAAIAPVGCDGLVDLAALATLCAQARGPIVAVQHVNSETGVIQPIDTIADIVRSSGGLLFVDAAQSAGKLPLPDADLIAVSAHKLGGPPGVGALLVRDLGALAPEGLGQERGYRTGTENLPAILGFAAALTAERAFGWVAPQRAWRADLDAAIVAAGGTIVCAASPRSPCIAACRLPGLRAETMLIRLDLMGFAVSAGSACSSGSLHPSHVLSAIGLDEREAGEVIRVSFGPSTTAAEITAFVDAYAGISREARTRAA